MDTTADHKRGEERDGWIALTGQGLEGAGRIPILYSREIERAEGRPRVFTPFTENEDQIVPDSLEIVAGIDPEDTSPLDGAVGLLLPGGGDVDPSHYGRPRHPRTKRVSRLRDRVESTLLREALRRDMPVLAICRGFQLLNVLLGGTLDQHLADNPELIDHDRDMPRAEPVHHIRIKGDSRLAKIFGETEVPVNSHHHQGLEKVSSELEMIAWAGDGTLEAVAGRDYSWVLGVQWHPEVMAPVDHRQMKIFDDFVEATRSYAAARSAA
ncbi:MAG: gamma-glutamyl-gamma-aminobutyrate hydrolase family protein [Actinomycetota bacterium]